jgi:hypothetical protein
MNAEQRIIVRTPLGEAILRSACTLLMCNVQWSLGDPNAELFLLTVVHTSDLGLLKTSLSRRAGVTDFGSGCSRGCHTECLYRPAVPAR